MCFSVFISVRLDFANLVILLSPSPDLLDFSNISSTERLYSASVVEVLLMTSDHIVGLYLWLSDSPVPIIFTELQIVPSCRFPRDT